MSQKSRASYRIPPNVWLFCLLFLMVASAFFIVWKTSQRTPEPANIPAIATHKQPSIRLPEVVSSTRAGWKTYTDYQAGYQIDLPNHWKVATYELHMPQGRIITQAAFDPVKVLSQTDFSHYDQSPGALWIMPENARISGVIGVSSMEKRMIGQDKTIETRYSKNVGTENEPNPFWTDRTSEIYYGWTDSFENRILLSYLNKDANNQTLQITLQDILATLRVLKPTP